MKRLHKRISEIPGDEGWWKQDGEETFIEIADTLSEKGFTEEEAIYILERCYNAVSGEYGN